MNLFLLLATVLTILAFVVHTFAGDRDLRFVEPTHAHTPLNREKWTLMRCGWHWISVDLLLASIGLVLITFTDYLDHEETWLHVLSVYFLAYTLVWILTLVISRSFPKNYLKLGQWVLLLAISGLIYGGTC